MLFLLLFQCSIVGQCKVMDSNKQNLVYCQSIIYTTYIQNLLLTCKTAFITQTSPLCHATTTCFS